MTAEEEKEYLAVVKKLWAYFRVFFLIFITTFWFVAVDYERLETFNVYVLGFCVVTSILIMWTSFEIYRFVKIASKETKHDEKGN